MNPRERWTLVWRAVRLACATKPHDRDRVHLAELALYTLRAGPVRDETDEEVTTVVSGWGWRLGCAFAMRCNRLRAFEVAPGSPERSEAVEGFRVSRDLLQGSARCPLPGPPVGAIHRQRRTS